MRAAAAAIATSPRIRSVSLRIELLATIFVMLIVLAIYGSRLNVQSLMGEETRWATGAREMLATGDWIVPRQQGRVFPERPPMTMWAMAVTGWLRGDVDPIAIRLPSVIAVVLTSLLVYGYTRAFASTIAATVAAIAYATMGQVLQIGRQGESEALFALLVGASLLIWHLGYLRGWRPVVVWMAVSRSLPLPHSSKDRRRRCILLRSRACTLPCVAIGVTCCAGSLRPERRFRHDHCRLANSVLLGN